MPTDADAPTHTINRRKRPGKKYPEKRAPDDAKWEWSKTNWQRYTHTAYHIKGEMRRATEGLLALATKYEDSNPDISVRCYTEIRQIIGVAVNWSNTKATRDAAQEALNQIEGLRQSAALQLAARRKRQAIPVQATVVTGENGHE